MMGTQSPERRVARRAAIGMVAGLVTFEVAHFGLGLLTGSLADQGGVIDVIYVIATPLFSAGFAVVGWAIVTRQPRNTIGWLLLAIPLVASFAFFVGDYATEALARNPGSLPFGRFAAWIDRWMIIPTLVLFIPFFLLFPDGRIPSRRWRPVLWLTIAGPTVAIVSFALTPGLMTGAFADLTTVRVTNPLGLEGLRGALEALTQVGSFASLGAAVLAGAAIVVRYRHASGEVRQQIRWLAFVGIAFLVELVLGLVATALSHDNGPAGDLMFLALFLTLMLGIPLACGIAILRYRLYDLDLVVRKAVVFGAMAVFVTAVYALLVGGVGALVGSRGSTTLSFVAAALLAVGFQPARDRARRFADRVVYGKRATPYEVLADFSDRMSETYATDDVLPRMAQILAEGTGADRAAVWLRFAGELRSAAVWPSGDAGRAIPMPTDELPGFGNEHATEVRHQGELLGALSVTMPASDPMSPPKEKLVRDLAAQAGLVLRNVRLIEELRSSRQRLVAAQDEERRKIERNIHDGAQQQLVAISVQLKLLSAQIDRDVESAKALAGRLQEAATSALEDLRDLARGIYPPLLADKGLVAALDSQARKSLVPVAIEPDGVGRYPQEIEAAVYFSCLEALQNVAKYAGASRATIRLGDEDGRLRFEVNDDGGGFDPSQVGYGTGLQGMADRLDALGGRLQVNAAPGAGTTIVGTLPVEHA
jgi:signal transduction histidine kinase